MKIIHKLFNKSVSNQIARKGIGPLIPAVSISFLAGNCSGCGQPISDFTIFGNALVLNNNGIFKLECSDCRLGKEIKIKKPEVLRGTINKNYILIDLYERIGNKSTLWIEVMMAWYNNYGILQDYKRYDEAYTIKFKDTPKDNLLSEDILYSIFEKEFTIQEKFGNIELLEKCGECSALWSKKHKDLIKKGKCWACGIPHQYQWNMRTTFEDEIKKIKKST